MVAQQVEAVAVDAIEIPTVEDAEGGGVPLCGEHVRQVGVGSTVAPAWLELEHQAAARTERTSPPVSTSRRPSASTMSAPVASTSVATPRTTRSPTRDLDVLAERRASQPIPRQGRSTLLDATDLIGQRVEEALEQREPVDGCASELGERRRRLEQLVRQLLARPCRHSPRCR